MNFFCYVPDNDSEGGILGSTLSTITTNYCNIFIQLYIWVYNYHSITTYINNWETVYIIPKNLYTYMGTDILIYNSDHPFDTIEPFLTITDDFISLSIDHLSYGIYHQL